MGSLKVPKEIFDPEQDDNSPRIGAYERGDKRMKSHKKKNRVSYKQGRDEIIPQTQSNEHRIFENKRIKQIKQTDSGSNRGSFSFFNVASMELKFKDLKIEPVDQELESVEIQQKYPKRNKQNQEDSNIKESFDLQFDVLNQKKGLEKVVSESLHNSQKNDDLIQKTVKKDYHTPKDYIKAYGNKLPPIQQLGLQQQNNQEDIEEVKIYSIQGSKKHEKESSSKESNQEEYYVQKYEKGDLSNKSKFAQNKKSSFFAKQKIRQLVVRIDNEDPQSEFKQSDELEPEQNDEKLSQKKNLIVEERPSFNSPQNIKFQETWEQQVSFLDADQANSSMQNRLIVPKQEVAEGLKPYSPINYKLQPQKTTHFKQSMSSEQMEKIKQEYIQDYQREKEILRQKSFQNSKYLGKFNVKVLEKVLKNRLKNQLVQDQVQRNQAIMDEIKNAQSQDRNQGQNNNRPEEKNGKQSLPNQNNSSWGSKSASQSPEQKDQVNVRQKSIEANQTKIERKSQVPTLWKKMCRGLKKLRFYVASALNTKICETLVIIVIIANSIVIAIYDRADRDSEMRYNKILDNIQFGITIFFTLECILKIFAVGFFRAPNSYFRDTWNWVDFFTIIVGWLEFIPTCPNLKFVRTLRVLKPMRSIHAIPGLKRLINSLLKSLALLANVVAFLVFFIIFFGIVGISLFKGKEYYRCHMSSLNGDNILVDTQQQNLTALILNKTYNWIIDQDQPRLCSAYGAGYQCNNGTICFNPGDYGQEVTDEYMDSAVFYGMQSFNNLVISLSTIFQSLTLEGWVFNMYNMMDAGQKISAPIYFLLIVIFGSFFLMNLILAAIMDSFSKVDKEMAVAEFKREFRGVEKQAQLTMQSKVKIVELMLQQKKKDKQNAAKNQKNQQMAQNSNMLVFMPHHEKFNVGSMQHDENRERIEEVQETPPKIMAMAPSITLKSRQTTLNERKIQKVEFEVLDPEPIIQKVEVTTMPYSKGDSKSYQKSNSMMFDKKLTTKLEIAQDQKMDDVMSPSMLDSLFTDKELDNEDDSSIHTEHIPSQLGEQQQNNLAVPGTSRQNSNGNPSQNQASNRNNIIYEDQGGGIKVSEQDGAGAVTENVQKLKRVETRRMKKMRIEEEQQIIQQTIIEKQIQARSEQNFVFKFFYSIAISEIFTGIIFLTITLNTIVIMMDKYPQSEQESEFQELANNVFYFIFLLEMIVKVIGLGFFNYLRDGYNIFDAFIIICSTIEIVLQFQDQILILVNKPDNIRRILLIFRPLRFLRIFKIARKWKSLNQIFSRLSNSFKQMMNFTILLSVFIFIFSLLGMELYANVVKFNNDNHPIKCVEGDSRNINQCLGLGTSLRINFDNLSNAARAVFVIIVGDDWNSIMDDYVRATSYMSIFFFVLITIFGNIVLMTLFLAIFLREFDNVDALRDENLVSSLHIKSISSKFKRQLTTQFVQSISSNSIFANLKCCKYMIKKLKIDAANYDDEDMEETNRALKIDLEDQNKEQVTEQASIDINQQNIQKVNVAPLPQQENRNQEDHPSPKGNLYTLVHFEKAKTQVGKKTSSKSLLANMLFIDQLKNSKTLNKHKRAHDAHFLEQIGVDVEDGKHPHSRHSAETKQKELVTKRGLGEKRMTNSIAEEIKNQHISESVRSISDFPNLFSKQVNQENSHNYEGDSHRNQTQNHQIIQQPIEQPQSIYQQDDFEINPNNQDEKAEMQIDRSNTLAGPFSGRKVIKKMVNIFNQAISQKTFEEEYLHQIEGDSLFLFRKSNKFRIFCLKLVESKSFKFLTFCLIILSTVTLGMQDPLSDPDSQFNQNLNYLDLANCLFFLVECVLKTIGRGFLFNGKYSYLSEGWNKLDFIVVIMSILSFFQFQSIKVTKTLRNLRVIRPLRMITKNKGLKIAVESLANSVKGIINITILTVLVYFVFGILGVNFFKGLYYRCNTNHLRNLSTANLVESIDSKWDCISSGGEWIKRKNRFDNVFYGAFVLFQISTTEGWYDVMMQAVDSTDIDYVPRQDHSPYASLFFISFIFIGGQFTMNLFQSVVISTYMLEKEQLTNNDRLTEMQQEWVKTQIKCYNSKPIILHPHVKQAWRISLIKFTTSLLFDQIVFVFISINTIILSLNWFLIDPQLESGFEIVNNVFTAFFTIEALIKILANGKLYFKENWNLFDFFVLLFTYIQIVYSIYVGDKLSIQGTFVRVLKFLRALRIVRRAEALKKIAMTLILSLPSMAHIAFLLFLLVVFYSMLGMNLFGRIMLHDALSEHANFQTFGTAFLTMMRCSTGEGWNEIMLSVMDQSSVLFQCQELNSYEDDNPENNGQAMQCGSYWTGLAFFLSYMMFVSQIFLNLFIAIILDGFDDSKQEQSLRINEEMVRKFQRSWADFDPEGTGYILVEDLENLICSHIIDKTHWIRGGEVLLRSQKLLKNFICLLELPMYHEYSHFNYYDVISRFAQTIFKVDFEKFVQDHYNRINRDKDKVTKKEPLQTFSDDLRSVSSRNTRRSLTQPVASSITIQESMDLLEAGIGGDDLDDLGIDDMQWMAVRDMLIFENFEEFYIDLIKKLTQNTHESIGLSEDLYREMMSRESLLRGQRDKFDSRIFSLLPSIVRNMRKLVMNARERNQRIGKQRGEIEARLEIERISQKCDEGHVFKTQFSIPLPQNDKNRQDMFQIFAKTMEEEPQSLSPSSGLNWVKQNVKRAITLMKIQQVQNRGQLFQSRTQVLQYNDRNKNNQNNNIQEQDEEDLQSLDQGQQRGFNRRQGLGEDFTSMAQPPRSNRRRGTTTTTSGLGTAASQLQNMQQQERRQPPQNKHMSMGTGINNQAMQMLHRKQGNGSVK